MIQKEVIYIYFYTYAISFQLHFVLTKGKYAINLITMQKRIYLSQ